MMWLMTTRPTQHKILHLEVQQPLQQQPSIGKSQERSTKSETWHFPTYPFSVPACALYICSRTFAEAYPSIHLVRGRTGQ